MIIPLLSGQCSLERLASLLGASYTGKNLSPLRLVTDSREIEEGDLFCALSDKRDGHDFTKEAEARGAAAILAERQTGSPLSHLLVNSVHDALLKWASFTLRESTVYTLAVTGSVGKTTVKEKCAAVLSKRYRTHKTEGNRNNHLGVPFTVLSMPRETEILIIECGMNNRGEIKRLSDAIAPDAAIITGVGYAHIGNLGSREAIADAKMEILSGMKKEAPLFLPYGEALLSPCFSRRNVHFVLPFEEKRREFPLPEDIGEKWGLGFAYQVGRYMKIEEPLLYEGLAEAAKHPTRRRVFTVKSVTLINDTYNASPESVIAALDLLAEKGEGRKIAVLGSMLELGDASHLLHRAVARHGARCADFIVYYGKEEEAVLNGAMGGGMQRESIFTFSDLEKAKDFLLSFVAPKDTLLFKASRGMQAEILFEAVSEHCKNF